MLWQKLQQKIQHRLVQNSLSEPLEEIAQNAVRPVVYIDSDQQLLSCIRNSCSVNQSYPVSTSRYGLGQKQGSFQTPVGLHRIIEKIGDGEPSGRVFKARKATSLLCSPSDEVTEDDVITSRILRLQGLEPGLNHGGEVDSYERYIYIHGTSDEAHIGQMASIGCVRMNNADIIEVFDQLEEGDLVLIE